MFELMVRGSARDLPMVKALLIPDAWEGRAAMPEAHRALFSYCSSVMEPWDGPAAVCGFGGRWVMAGMDRNGLRPLRYTVTSDNMLIVGSETGMVRVDEGAVVEKGRVGPGEMIAVDLREGRFYHNCDIRDALAGDKPFGKWVKNIRKLDSVIAPEHEEPVELDRGELRRRQLLYGWSMEDLELILHPMVADSKEPVGSMGDDTPIAVLSDKYRGLHHFFRQNFSQVTNPPVDSLRESAVMTLSTRLGNLGNVLDEDGEPVQPGAASDSPVLTNGEFNAMRRPSWATARSRSTARLDPEGGDNAHRAMPCGRIQPGGGGRWCAAASCHLIVLSDKERRAGARAGADDPRHRRRAHPSRAPERCALSRRINVRSGECMDVHYFAVLIGVAARPRSMPIWRRRRSPPAIAAACSASSGSPTACSATRAAAGAGLLKVMSKMGISVISSYRGGGHSEAIGLERAPWSTSSSPACPAASPASASPASSARSWRCITRAFNEDVIALPVGGFYRYRRGGEAHAFHGNGAIHILQRAV